MDNKIFLTSISNFKVIYRNSSKVFHKQLQNKNFINALLISSFASVSSSRFRKLFKDALFAKVMDFSCRNLKPS